MTERLFLLHEQSKLHSSYCNTQSLSVCLFLCLPTPDTRLGGTKYGPQVYFRPFHVLKKIYIIYYDYDIMFSSKHLRIALVLMNL